MPLDPDTAALLEQVNQAPPMSQGTPEFARDMFRTMSAYAASRVPPIEVAATEDIEIPGEGMALPARVYRPRGDGPFPTLAFFHGGGFTIGDIDSYELQCRDVCAQAGAVVVSTDYRLAPEHPFPAAVDDCTAAMRWIGERLDGFGGDARRYAVGGDSAGGNLAAVCAQVARDEGGPPLAAQLLIYPATDLFTERPSHSENAEGYFLTRADMEWFQTNYVPSHVDEDDPRISPLKARDLSGLPPAVVATAGYDPLRDDGEAYAEALTAAGVRVIHRRFDSLTHGFFGFGPFSAAAREAIAQICVDLRDVLAA
jgi:acetyl esterase